jgi:hypothetical protein
MVETSTQKKIVLKKSTIELLDSSIFYLKYDESVHLELSDFREARDVFEEFGKMQKLKLLVEFPSYTTISTEARQLAENEPIDALAEAIICHSLAQMILLRFYLITHKQEHPVKAFKNKLKALAWLRKIEG